MLRAFRWLWIGAAACLAGAGDAQVSLWGLRNAELLPEGYGWEDPATFGGTFGAYGAGHMAFFLWWPELQESLPATSECPSPVGTDLTALETRLNLAKEIGAVPVIVFHCFPQAGGTFWGMKIELAGQPSSYTGPVDLDRTTTIQWPPPLACGYSPRLYNVVRAVADYIAAQEPAETVYMRFHNEAWTEWPLGAPAQWADNLDNYLRSYLTFRLAIEDAEAANPTLDFKVGHGSIPRGRLVPDAYYDMGVAGSASTKQWVVQRLDAYTERNHCAVEQKYGITMPINTWAEAVIFAGPGTEVHPHNLRMDAWMDRFVQWTKDNYFDFTTQHPHEKPFFIALEQSIFNARVGGTPKPWIAAEAAFELLDEEAWGLFPCPGPDLERFVAEDYVRKWCTLIASNTPFCTPIIGGPHPVYMGIYRPEMENPNPPVVGCVPTGCPPEDDSPCFSGICPLQAEQAFAFLSGEIGAATVQDLSTETHARYRFDPDGALNGRLVEVIWRRALFDSAAATSNVPIAQPGTLMHWAEHDILGGPPLATGTGGFTLAAVGQPPRVIIWTP